MKPGEYYSQTKSRRTSWKGRLLFFSNLLCEKDFLSPTLLIIHRTFALLLVLLPVSNLVPVSVPAHTEHVTTETQPSTVLNSLDLAQAEGTYTRWVFSEHYRPLCWHLGYSPVTAPSMWRHFLLVRSPFQSHVPRLIRHLNSSEPCCSG